MAYAFECFAGRSVRSQQQSHAPAPRRRRPTSRRGTAPGPLGFLPEPLEDRRPASGMVAATALDSVVVGNPDAAGELVAGLQPADSTGADPLPFLSDLPPLPDLLQHPVAPSPTATLAAPATPTTTPTKNRVPVMTTSDSCGCQIITLFVSVRFDGLADEEYPETPAYFIFDAWPDCGAHGAPASVTAWYSLGGPATQGADYNGEILAGSVTIPLDSTGRGSKAVELDTLEDAIVEDAENVEVGLTGAQINDPPPDSSWTWEIPPPGSAYGTIRDNEPAVSIAATDDTAVEGAIDPATGEKDYIEFTFTRTKSYRYSIDVNYWIEPPPSDPSYTAVEGPMETGGDFGPLYGTVTIPAGAPSVTLRVVPHDDDIQEVPTESFTMWVRPGAGYRVNPAQDVARGNIKDDDVLVILISGHTQNGDNDDDPTTGPLVPSKTAGILKLEPKLTDPKVGVEAKNIKKFSEDPGNKQKEPFNLQAIDVTKCGPDDLEKAIADTVKGEVQLLQQRLPNGVLRVAMIGYSHGGGLVYNVAKRLKDDPAYAGIQGKFAITFTAYMDGVVEKQVNPQTSVPPGSQYHANWFQGQGIDLRGGPMQGAAVKVSQDVDVAENPATHVYQPANVITHFTIDDDPLVTDLQNPQQPRQVKLYDWLIEEFKKANGLP